MAAWLVKTEPSVYSIDDLRRDRRTEWDGVRNYQARNFLQRMKVGERVLFYHSVDQPIGIAGVATVDREAAPDPSQFDRKSEYFDAKASPDKPRWFCPRLRFELKFPEVVELARLRDYPALSGMALLQRGSRLSVQPVTSSEFVTITKLAAGGK